jgi:hypothetical protein
MAYPSGEWLCFTGTGADRNAAEADAMNALAQSIRVDIVSATKANQTLAGRIERHNKKTISESSEYRQFTQNLTALSSVSGLSGIQKEFWTAANGEVYANVRMNRAECSARYERLIEENENFTRLIREKAEAAAGSFEAPALLDFAEPVTALTGDFYAILSVLQNEAPGQKYGNAVELKLLREELSRLIVVRVEVRGDVDGRLARAFASVFSERGYRTAGEKTEGSHILRADFKTEDLGQTDGQHHYVRFTLGGALIDKNGAELLSFSETDRAGHLRPEAARERAVQRTERFIAETGFAGQFDAYLDSLL